MVDKLFDWIEKRTMHVILVPLVVVVLWTAIVALWQAFQTGPWKLAYEFNGQIGDFLGGVMNPIVAFLALLWLRRGVLEQKEELRATKEALRDSAVAQDRQVRLSAITALVQVEIGLADEHMRRISRLDSEIAAIPPKTEREIIKEMNGSVSPSTMKRAKLEATRDSESAQLNDIRMRQYRYAEQLQELTLAYTNTP